MIGPEQEIRIFDWFIVLTIGGLSHEQNRISGFSSHEFGLFAIENASGEIPHAVFKPFPAAALNCVEEADPSEVFLVKPRTLVEENPVLHIDGWGAVYISRAFEYEYA